MKKNILLLCAIPMFLLGLYSYAHSNFSRAFSFQSVCQPPLRTFFDGNPAFQIKYPPGGGTTCATIADCPKISLPVNSTVYSMKLDMAITDPATEIGTPYIWVPVSGNNQIAQIDTRDGFEAEIARYNIGANPSRTFVIPGGDVWVGNRDSGNVTKLSPLTGNSSAGGTCPDGKCGVDETIYSCKIDCSGSVCGDGTGTCNGGAACGNGIEDCKEYKVVGNYPTGSGPRGVTGDINGNVWVGNYGDGTIVKLNPATGGILTTVNVGGNPYGLIADQFGYVWVSNRGSGNVQAVSITSNTITQTVAIPGPYGIGMNKAGDILVATCCGNQAYVINGYGSGVPGTIKAGFPVNLAGGVSTRGRGIASDLNSNIWVGSDAAQGTIYSFRPSGAVYCPLYNSPNDTVGVAVDFNNNVWVVPYNGNVEKLKPNNVTACGAVTQVATVFVPGGLLYNYSDMTGLRTIPKSLSIGGFKVPLSGAGIFDVCSDGTGTCTDPGPCAPISAILATCAPNAMNKCDIPLNIFSMQSGEYTLKNLEVIYGAQEPVTTGGLVSCGRRWDDPKTPIKENAPCDICHIIYLINLAINYLVSFVSIISVLALLIVGYLFITSAGDPQKRKDAKTRLKWVLVGFVIIFLAWLIVDFLFAVWGYLDPLGGKWYVTCD